MSGGWVRPSFVAHELPTAVTRRIMAEAFRVLRPGQKPAQPLGGRRAHAGRKALFRVAKNIKIN